MEYNSQLGVYTPSFFSITLNFAHQIQNVQDIPEHLMPTFYHEYFHFIQDLTTPYGVHLGWGNMSRIAQSINILQEGGSEIQLPISSPEREKLVDEINLFQALNGDRKLANIDGVDPETLVFHSTSLQLREEMKPFEKEPKTWFINLILKDSSDKKYYYWLGAAAIIEAMAEIIQEKHFGNTNLPRFPYRIVQDFLINLLPDLANRKDAILVLCDLALMTNNPGFYLNSIAVNSSLRHGIPDDAKDIYQIGFDFYQKHEYDVSATFNEYKNQLITNLSQLFGHDVFHEEKEWLITIVENGYNLRNENKALLLDLFRDEAPISENLSYVISKIGTPDIVNFNLDRMFTLPNSLKGKEDAIHPILMKALFQFHNDLIVATPKCSMVEICNHFEQPVDKRCSNKHWERLEEKLICPLMAFYLSYGFKKIKPVK